MRKYMMHSVLHNGYIPRVYKPTDDDVILAGRVTCFYGCQQACMMRGHPLIEHLWSTRDSLFHVGPCAESMPLAAFEDMHQCLHFADDWVEDADANWEDVYLNKKVESLATAKHCVNFGMVKDAFNKHWKELVT